MAGLNFIHSDTKRALLKLMKQQGRISLDDAESETGLTRTTLREHIGQLERDGLVLRSTKRQGRGRPSLRYNLTAEGEGLFPSQDHVLLGRMIEFLEQENEDELILAFFRNFWDERLEDVQYRLGKLDPDDREGRLEVLERLLDEQGFMPEFSQGEQGLVIRECNCPFPEAVRRTRLPCRLEAEFFERVFDRPIGRVSYIPDGSPACTYEFAPLRTD